jgi:hypothetical protein
MPEREFNDFIAGIGAEEFMSVCAIALERQRDRLGVAPTRLSEEGPALNSRELAPDVWFAVVALHRSFVALDFAGKVSTTHGDEIRTLTQALPNREAIKRVRDVYEHFDDYFRLRGRLQEREGPRPDMHLPQVSFVTAPSGVAAVNVGISAASGGPGAEWVDLFATIDVVLAALRAALKLVRE